MCEYMYMHGLLCACLSFFYVYVGDFVYILVLQGDGFMWSDKNALLILRSIDRGVNMSVFIYF